MIQIASGRFSYFLFFLSTFPKLFAQPDLMIASISNFKAVAGQGSEFIAAYYSITNQGSLPTDSSWSGIYLSKDKLLSKDDLLLKEVRVEPLDIKGFTHLGGYQVQIPSKCEPGDYWLLYTVDSRGEIKEGDESNNMETQALAIQRPVIDYYLELKPDKIYQHFPIGLKHAILFRCLNYGNTDAPSVPVTLFLSTNKTIDHEDLKLGEFLPQGSTISKINGAAIRPELTIPANTKEGNYFLLFSIDHKRRYSESNEENNLVARTIILRKPYLDLKITEVFPYKDTLASGVEVNLGFHFIQNTGNVVAKHIPYSIFLSKDTILDTSDFCITKGSIDSLGLEDERLGFYFKGCVPAEVKSGKYYYVVDLKSSGTYPERNNQNNRLRKPVFVQTDSLRIPSDLVRIGPTGPNTCKSSPLQVKSCRKKIVYHAPFTLNQNNIPCFFEDIVEIHKDEAGENFKVKFERFNLETDTILVFDNTRLLGRFTGQSGPETLSASSGILRIARVSHSFLPQKPEKYGFMLRVLCEKLKETPVPKE